MGAQIYAQRRRLGEGVQVFPICALIDQIAFPALQPRNLFKTKIFRSFGRRSAKSHLVENQGVKNLEISEDALYPTMLRKINVVRGFSEDSPKNFVAEKKGAI